MNDIKDRLSWRADNAGNKPHSDMIYRDALYRIERLEAALREMNEYPMAYDARQILIAALVGKKEK